MRTGHTYQSRERKEGSQEEQVEVQEAVQDVKPPWLGSKNVGPDITSKDVIEDNVERDNHKLVVIVVIDEDERNLAVQEHNMERSYT